MFPWAELASPTQGPFCLVGGGGWAGSPSLSDRQITCTSGEHSPPICHAHGLSKRRTF